MNTGSQSIEWNPKAILSGFTLVDLVRIDSANHSLLILKPINGKDSQIICKSSLIDQFNIVDHFTKRLCYLATTLLYLLVMAMIFFIKKNIKAQINLKYHDIINYCSLIFKNADKTYVHTIIILFLCKLILVSVQQMTVYGNYVHDDALFIRQAYSIAAGNWLGDYDSFTLIKGFIYPLFISLSSFFGIPLFLAQHLLYGFACLVLVRSFSAIMNGTSRKVLLFSILLFNPMASSDFTLRILRESLYTSLTMIVIAAFVGMCMSRKHSSNSILRWSLLASVSLFAFWNTREEGLLIFPLIVGLTAFSILTISPEMMPETLNQRTLRRISASWKPSIIFLLPFIILLFGNFVVASINYYKYGRFVTNEMKSEAYTSAFSALSDIKQNTRHANVPVPEDVRIKAYKASPSFAELEFFLEGSENGFLNYGNGDKKEISGAGFMWAFREAAARAGYHCSLPQSQEFYEQVAREINLAFKKGTLEKSEAFTVFEFTLDQRLIAPIKELLRKELVFIATFHGYSSQASDSKGDDKSFARFQNITNEAVYFPKDNAFKSYRFIMIKYKIMNLVAKIYGILNPLILAISLLSFMFLTIVLAFQTKGAETVDTWLFLFGFLYLVITRMLLIAYISASQWYAINGIYLSLVYPFLLSFEILSIFAAVDYLKRKRQLA